VFRLRSYERISVAISLQRGPVDPKFHIEWVAPTNYSSSQKTRLNDFSYDIKIWTDLSTIFSQCKRLTDGQTDGRTDRRTDRIFIARPRLHSMQRGKNPTMLLRVEWVAPTNQNIGDVIFETQCSYSVS